MSNLYDFSNEPIGNSLANSKAATLAKAKADKLSKLQETTNKKLVTNDDVHRRGMEQRFDSLALLNTQNKDLISQTMRSDGSGNIFGEDIPLGLDVERATTGEHGYFGRPLTDTRGIDGRSIYEAYNNPTQDTDYYSKYPEGEIPTDFKPAILDKVTDMDSLRFRDVTGGKGGTNKSTGEEYDLTGVPTEDRQIGVDAYEIEHTDPQSVEYFNSPQGQAKLARQRQHLSNQDGTATTKSYQEQVYDNLLAKQQEQNETDIGFRAANAVGSAGSAFVRPFIGVADIAAESLGHDLGDDEELTKYANEMFNYDDTFLNQAMEEAGDKITKYNGEGWDVPKFFEVVGDLAVNPELLGTSIGFVASMALGGPAGAAGKAATAHKTAKAGLKVAEKAGDVASIAAATKNVAVTKRVLEDHGAMKRGLSFASKYFGNMSNTASMANTDIQAYAKEAGVNPEEVSLEKKLSITAMSALNVNLDYIIDKGLLFNPTVRQGIVDIARGASKAQLDVLAKGLGKTTAAAVIGGAAEGSTEYLQELGTQINQQLGTQAGKEFTEVFNNEKNAHERQLSGFAGIAGAQQMNAASIAGSALQGTGTIAEKAKDLITADKKPEEIKDYDKVNVPVRSETTTTLDAIKDVDQFNAQVNQYAPESSEYKQYEKELTVQKKAVLSEIESKELSDDELKLGSSKNAEDIIEAIYDLADGEISEIGEQNIFKIAEANNVSADKVKIIKDRYTVGKEATVGIRGYKRMGRTINKLLDAAEVDEKQVKREVGKLVKFKDSQVSYAKVLEDKITEIEDKIAENATNSTVKVDKSYKVEGTKNLEGKPWTIHVQTTSDGTKTIHPSTYTQLADKESNIAGIDEILNSIAVDNKDIDLSYDNPNQLVVPQTSDSITKRDTERYTKDKVNKFIGYTEGSKKSKVKTYFDANKAVTNKDSFTKNDVVAVLVNSSARTKKDYINRMNTKGTLENVLLTRLKKAQKANAEIVIDIPNASRAARDAIIEQLTTNRAGKDKYETVTASGRFSPKASYFKLLPKEQAEKINKETIDKLAKEKTTIKDIQNVVYKSVITDKLIEQYAKEGETKELVKAIEDKLAGISKIPENIKKKAKNLILKKLREDKEAAKKVYKDIEKSKKAGAEVSATDKQPTEDLKDIDPRLAKIAEEEVIKEQVNLDYEQNILDLYRDIPNIMAADTDVIVDMTTRLNDILDTVTVDEAIGKQQKNDIKTNILAIIVNVKKILNKGKEADFDELTDAIRTALFNESEIKKILDESLAIGMDGMLSSIQKKDGKEKRAVTLNKKGDTDVIEQPLNPNEYLKITSGTVVNSIDIKHLGKQVVSYAQETVDTLKGVIADKSTSKTKQKKFQEKTIEEFNVANSPFRALFYNKNGAINRNAALAVRLAFDEYFSFNAPMFNSEYKTKDDLARMLGIDSSQVTNDMMRLLGDKGVFNKTAANEMGKLVMQHLGIKPDKAKGYDSQIFAKLVADAGEFSVLYGMKTGLVVRDEISASKYKSVVLKNSDASNITEAGESSIYFIKSKTGEKNEYLREDNRDTFEYIADELAIETNYKRGPVTFERSSKHTGVARNNITERPSEADDILQKMVETSFKIDRDLISNMFDVDYDNLEEFNIDNEKTQVIMNYMGYETEKNMSKMTKSERESREANNAAIEKSIEDLIEYATDPEFDTEMYFDWFYTSNGRYMMDSNTVNPQTDKLHRFIAVNSSHVNQKIEMSAVGGKKLSVFEYAIAQAFGFAVDKKNSTKIKKVADAILGNEQTINDIEKALWAQEEMKIGDIELEVEHISHTLQAIQAIKAYHKAKKAGKKSFNATISVEFDAVTSGFALKLQQMPILDEGKSFKETRKWMEKTGFLIGKEGPTSMNDVLDVDGFLDSYQTLAQQALKLTDGEVQDAFKNEKKKAGLQATWNSALWKGFKSVLPEESEDGSIPGALRQLFKDPFMTFNYSAGIESIKRSLAGNQVNDILNKIAMNQYSNKKEETNFRSLEGQLVKIYNNGRTGKNISAAEFRDMLRTQDIDTILMIDTGYSKTNLEQLMTGYLRASYGAKVEQIMTDNFSPFMEAHDNINNAFKVAFYNFKLEFDDRMSQVKGAITDEIELNIVNDLLDKFPIIKGPLSAGLKDGVAVFKTKSVTPFGTKERVLPAQTQIKENSIKGIEGKSVKARHVIKELATAISAGSVIPIHYIDAGIMARTVKKVTDILAIHDAIMPGLDTVFDAVKEYNKIAYEMSQEYSFIAEIDKMLDRTEIDAKYAAKAREMKIEVKVDGELVKMSLADAVKHAKGSFKVLATNVKEKREALKKIIEKEGITVVHMAALEDTGHVIPKKAVGDNFTPMTEKAIEKTPLKGTDDTTGNFVQYEEIMNDIQEAYNKAVVIAKKGETKEAKANREEEHTDRVLDAIDYWKDNSDIIKGFLKSKKVSDVFMKSYGLAYNAKNHKILLPSIDSYQTSMMTQAIEHEIVHYKVEGFMEAHSTNVAVQVIDKAVANIDKYRDAILASTNDRYTRARLSYMMSGKSQRSLRAELVAVLGAEPKVAAKFIEGVNTQNKKEARRIAKASTGVYHKIKNMVFTDKMINTEELMNAISQAIVLGDQFNETQPETAAKAREAVADKQDEDNKFGEEIYKQKDGTISTSTSYNQIINTIKEC